MELFHILLHLDKYLVNIINNYHDYFYVLLFIVIFCETGLVITPFLPGDSLLFLAGGLAGVGSLNFWALALTISLAAFLGDNSNFFIGKFLGDTLFNNPKSKIFRQDILRKTHHYFEKHGKITVILARFIPLVRTFAPFVAGLGHMKYTSFISFSSIGSALWVGILLGGGFIFGNLPFIKNHLSLVILSVMVVSILPIIKMIIDELRNK